MAEVRGCVGRVPCPAERRSRGRGGRERPRRVAGGGRGGVAALVAGIARPASGSLAAVVLAVVALTPIAVHEVVVATRAVRAAAAGAGSRRRGASWTSSTGRSRSDPAPATCSRSRRPAGRACAGSRRPLSEHGGALGCALPDLDVAAGARVVVTGPSGAGKSTLAAALPAVPGP